MTTFKKGQHQHDTIKHKWLQFKQQWIYNRNLTITDLKDPLMVALSEMIPDAAFQQLLIDEHELTHSTSIYDTLLPHLFKKEITHFFHLISHSDNSKKSLRQYRACLRTNPALLFSKNQAGIYPLDFALQKETPNNDLIKLLLGHMKKQTRTSFFINEIKEGNYDRVLLLKNVGISTTAKDRDGKRPLHWAAWLGHTTIAKLLIEADPGTINSKDNDGRTALHEAAFNDHHDVIRLLVENGSNLFLKTRKHATARQLATFFGHTTSELLLSQYEDNASNTDSPSDKNQLETPFQKPNHVANKKHTDINLNLSDDHKDTLLSLLKTGISISSKEQEKLLEQLMTNQN